MSDSSGPRRLLGRVAHDPARLAAAPRLIADGEKIPVNLLNGVNWGRRVAPGNWGMCLNDELPSCTIAAAAHALVVWESYVGMMSFMSDANVRAGLTQVGATSEGARCLDVLQEWVGSGLPYGSGYDRLAAFGVVNHLNHTEVLAGLWAFGCLYVGQVIREAQETESRWCDLTSPILGGHCTIIVQGHPRDGLTCVTWGETRQQSWEWWDACTDECYALVSRRWVDTAGSTPSGFNLDRLVAESQALA